MRRARSTAQIQSQNEIFEEDLGGDEYDQEVIEPKEINHQTASLMGAVEWATD